ncbi:MAG: hypothetical protein R3B49_02595 [Phycisphaerales bacterium]
MKYLPGRPILFLDVLTRFLLILTLLWQPIALWTPVSHPGSGQVCAPTSCCTTVERVTCCGERVVEQVCPMSGGECHCAASPTDTPPAPVPAPHPRTERETSVAVPTPATRVVTLIDSAFLARPLCTGETGPLSGKTHNEIQARLGVWRT